MVVITYLVSKATAGQYTAELPPVENALVIKCRRYNYIFPQAHGFRIAHRDKRRTAQCVAELCNCAVRRVRPLWAHPEPDCACHLCEFRRASNEGYIAVSTRRVERDQSCTYKSHSLASYSQAPSSWQGFSRKCTSYHCCLHQVWGCLTVRWSTMVNRFICSFSFRLKSVGSPFFSA